MEYMALALPISLLEPAEFTKSQQRWYDELSTLMEAFHDAGYLHGDLRDPNILCDGDRMVLIDFDWGGVAGEAKYPSTRLNEDLTEGRESQSLLISREDDVRVLKRTFAALLNSDRYQGKE